MKYDSSRVSSLSYSLGKASQLQLLFCPVPLSHSSSLSAFPLPRNQIDSLLLYHPAVLAPLPSTSTSIQHHHLHHRASLANVISPRDPSDVQSRSERATRRRGEFWTPPQEYPFSIKAPPFLHPVVHPHRKPVDLS